MSRIPAGVSARFTAAGMVGFVITGCAMTEHSAAFRLQEATISSVQRALATGELTCAQLTRLYLNRIAAYDRNGPALRSIITVNPRAMELAAEMDRNYKADPASAGPLHCIPIILKDNFNTYDMPTTGGFIGMRDSV